MIRNENSLRGLALDPAKLYYLSHPYTTYGDRGANRIKARGIEIKLHHERNVKVINPLLLELGYDGRDAMEQCLCMLAACDGIIMSPDWEKSEGCRTEYEYARECGLEIVMLPGAGE